MRFTDVDVQRLAAHLDQCGVCSEDNVCDEGRALVRPLTQRLADDIDREVAEKVYAELKPTTD